MAIDKRDRQILTLVAADRVIKLRTGWRTGGFYTAGFDARVLDMVEAGLIEEKKGRAVLTGQGKAKLI